MRLRICTTFSLHVIAGSVLLFHVWNSFDSLTVFSSKFSYSIDWIIQSFVQIRFMEHYVLCPNNFFEKNAITVQAKLLYIIKINESIIKLLTQKSHVNYIIWSTWVYMSWRLPYKETLHTDRVKILFKWQKSVHVN